MNKSGIEWCDHTWKGSQGRQGGIVWSYVSFLFCEMVD